MKRIITLIEQDLKLLLRNAIFWVLSVSLVLIVVTINFLIPEDSSLSETAIVTYGYPQAAEGASQANSPAEVENQVREKGVLGVIRQGDQVTLLHDGLNEKSLNALASFLIPPGQALEPVQIETIRQSSRVIPENLRLTPIFICFEAVVLGFLMAAILLFGEKQDMVLKAYRISPGATLPYILAKVILFASVGSLYALLMGVTTVGLNFDWLQFILLTIMGCVLYTLLGLISAVFFKDISGWFFVAILVLALNMLPMISYSVPTFSPEWLTLIPSYSSLFAYEEVLFSSGKNLMSTYGILFAEILGAFLLCTVLVKKKLMSAN